MKLILTILLTLFTAVLILKWIIKRARYTDAWTDVMLRSVAKEKMFK